MGIITTVDERLESVKTNVDHAIHHLSEIVIDKCWGYEKLSQEYKKNLLEILTKLMEIQRFLEGE